MIQNDLFVKFLGIKFDFYPGMYIQIFKRYGVKVGMLQGNEDFQGRFSRTGVFDPIQNFVNVQVMSPNAYKYTRWESVRRAVNDSCGDIY